MTALSLAYMAADIIALGILEAVQACTRASEMIERLDGAYIHDGDWDEEQFILEP